MSRLPSGENMNTRGRCVVAARTVNRSVGRGVGTRRSQRETVPSYPAVRSCCSSVGSKTPYADRPAPRRERTYDLPPRGDIPDPDLSFVAADREQGSVAVEHRVDGGGDPRTGEAAQDAPGVDVEEPHEAVDARDGHEPSVRAQVRVRLRLRFQRDRGFDAGETGAERGLEGAIGVDRRVQPVCLHGEEQCEVRVLVDQRARLGREGACGGRHRLLLGPRCAVVGARSLDERQRARHDARRRGAPRARP